VKHLLDTHVLIWWLTDDRKLPKPHARLLERSERSQTPVGLSAMSLWEIAKLAERGRIELTRSVDESLEQLEASPFISVLPLTGRVAIESTRLGARFHADPVDQIIVATARCHGLTLLTADERIIDSGVVAVMLVDVGASVLCAIEVSGPCFGRKTKRPIAATRIKPSAGTAYRNTIGEKRLAKNFLSADGADGLTTSARGTTPADELSCTTSSRQRAHSAR